MLFMLCNSICNIFKTKITCYSPDNAGQLFTLDLFINTGGVAFSQVGVAPMAGVKNAAWIVSSIFRENLFSGKTAIVTGGGTGIGHAVTQELLYLGC